MKKEIVIKGMSCPHCQASVERALNEIEGVSAKADFKKGIAVAKIEGEVDDSVIKNAIKEAGFEVVEIHVKKGIFG